MGRSKVKNIMTTPEWLAKVNPYNMELMEEYLENCSSTKADSTIREYRCDLKIAFCWGLNHLDNKPFFHIIRTSFRSTMWRAATRRRKQVISRI